MAGDDVVQCSFCGFTFSVPAHMASCQSCPLNKNCRMVCCPRCGYKMPPPSSLERAGRIVLHFLEKVMANKENER